MWLSLFLGSHALRNSEAVAYIIELQKWPCAVQANGAYCTWRGALVHRCMP